MILGDIEPAGMTRVKTCRLICEEPHVSVFRAARCRCNQDDEKSTLQVIHGDDVALLFPFQWLFRRHSVRIINSILRVKKQESAAVIHDDFGCLIWFSISFGFREVAHKERWIASLRHSSGDTGIDWFIRSSWPFLTKPRETSTTTQWKADFVHFELVEFGKVKGNRDW